MRSAEPSWAARNPVPVKIPVPIMLETTRAVALTNPNWRSSAGRVGVELDMGLGAKRRGTSCTSYHYHMGRGHCVQPLGLEAGAEALLPRRQHPLRRPA